MNRKRFSIEQQLNTIGKYLNILHRKQKKKKKKESNNFKCQYIKKTIYVSNKGKQKYIGVLVNSQLIFQYRLLQNINSFLVFCKYFL